MGFGALLRNRLGRLVEDLLIATKVVYPNNTEQITAPIGSCAHMYVVTPMATNIAVADTFYKLAGTTAAVLCEEFEHSNGRLTYLASPPSRFTLIAGFSVSSDKKDLIVSFLFYKNGVGPLVASLQKRTLRAVGDIYVVTLSAKVELTQGEYIEVWGTSDVADTNLTLQTLGLVVTG